MDELNQEQQAAATSGIFENMCPFDFEEMEIITIEHGVKCWHCPVCDYIRPV